MLSQSVWNNACIAIFNCDELINIFLISARYGKDSDSWCGDRQISLVRERILIVQEYPVVDLLTDNCHHPSA